MNDTVREDLESKIAPAGDFGSVDVRQDVPVPLRAAAVETAPAERLVAVKINTSDLAIKHTSPTLVEFQTKNATLPDWRLQLQNSVRQRNSGANREQPSADAVSVGYRKQLVTSGANALKPEYVEEAKPTVHQNLTVANALKRIEDSRRAFLPEENKRIEVAAKSAVNRNFPFNVVSRSAESPTKRSDVNASAYPSAKPKLVSSLRIEKKAFDTNKLPPIPKPAKIATSLDSVMEFAAEEPKRLLWDEDRIQIKEKSVESEIIDTEEAEMDEIDDLAPLAMRFNAGLFDLIIGGFASFILLSPFFLSGGAWLSLAGFLAFAAALAIVMFVYLTAAIGFFGKTLGMRLFSLELVDVEESAYPTLHQAAVSSAVYLLSLAFGGIGLLPVFFNEEKRAAHDLVSGTILIKEY